MGLRRACIISLVVLLLGLSNCTLVSPADTDTCASATSYVVQIKISNPGGSTADFFEKRLCDTSSECTGVSVENIAPLTVSDVPQTLVTLTDHTYALEAVLAYVSAVRENRLAMTTSDVTASAVYLITQLQPTTLFLANPLSPFNVQTKMVPTCASSTGFWAFALIGIIPIGLMALRYSFTRGQEDESLKMSPFMTMAMQSMPVITPQPEVPAATPPRTPNPKPMPAPMEALTGKTPVEEEISGDPPAVNMEHTATPGMEPAGENQYIADDILAEEEGRFTLETYMDEETGEVYQVYVDTVTGDMYRYEEEDLGAGDGADEMVG